MDCFIHILGPIRSNYSKLETVVVLLICQQTFMHIDLLVYQMNIYSRYYMVLRGNIKILETVLPALHPDPCKILVVYCISNSALSNL